MAANTQHDFFVIEIGCIPEPVRASDWREYERYDYFTTARNRARVLLRDDNTLQGRLRVCKQRPLMDVTLDQIGLI